MSVTHGLCHSFIEELTEALHDLEDNTLKLALYSEDATLSPSATTAYSATNEVSGTGYTAGGVTLVLSNDYPASADGVTSYRFDDATWGPGASFTTVHGGLIYNSSKSNRAVAVLKFSPGLVVSSATLTISFPTTMPALFRFKG